MRTGMMITAAAGPLSNLILAVLCAVSYGLLCRFTNPAAAITELVFIGLQLNLALFVFNFIPVPPLDGSRIVDGFLPYRLRGQWEQVQRYSWVILLGVIFFGGSLMQVPISWLLQHLWSLGLLIAGRR